MRRLTKLLFALTGAAAIGLIFLLNSDPEPKYQGRRLSQWLAIRTDRNSPLQHKMEADIAIRRIGTNNLPLLVKLAVPQSSRMKQKICRILIRLPVFMVPERLAVWASNDRDTTRQDAALRAIQMLGPQASPAIPQLARIANDPSQAERAQEAVVALGKIGRRALPALIDVVSNTAASARLGAIYEIAPFGTNAQPALPALVQCVEDADEHTANAACLVLGGLSLSPEISIPALVKGLRRADSSREGAVHGLRAFGPAALVAVPEIEKLVATETNQELKNLMIDVCRGITAEASIISPAQ